MFRSLVLVAVAAFAFSACDSTDDPDTQVDLSVRTATDVAADPAQRNPDGSPGTATNRYTLYSLRENRVVLNYNTASRADSATTAWDIGFRGTSIIVNGGTSGPGQGQAVVIAAPFAEVTGVPVGTAFRTDGTDTCGTRPARALCEISGDANGFYTYTPFTGSPGGYITPTAGRTILVRTADGAGYAKVQVRSYYQGALEASAIVPGSVGRYYTFSYVLNPSGTSFTAAL
ncbi:MAG TPA: HmuY family protein [Rubricoccaceae bacterium]|jgi:hypothetical protein